MQIRRSDFTSPEHLGSRRLPAAATFHHFRSEEEAKKVFREFSPYVLDLDGLWQFRYTTAPESAALDDPGAEWGDCRVPDSWVMRGFDRPQYTNVQMPFEAPTGEIPEKNPTGLYRRDFTVPEAWRGQRIVLRFEGAESAFLCRLNGAWVGGSKDSRGASEFDVTARLRPGANRIEVVVIKWSDGTWLDTDLAAALQNFSDQSFLMAV